MLASVAATVRLLASLARLTTLAAHHRLILILILVLVAAVAVATVTCVIGHLYMYLTFLLRTLDEKIKCGHIFSSRI